MITPPADDAALRGRRATPPSWCAADDWWPKYEASTLPFLEISPPSTDYFSADDVMWGPMMFRQHFVIISGLHFDDVFTPPMRSRWCNISIDDDAVNISLGRRYRWFSALIDFCEHFLRWCGRCTRAEMSWWFLFAAPMMCRLMLISISQAADFSGPFLDFIFWWLISLRRQPMPWLIANRRWLYHFLRWLITPLMMYLADWFSLITWVGPVFWNIVRGHYFIYRGGKAADVPPMRGRRGRLRRM